MAPNLVTLTGTAILFSNCIVYFSQDSTMEKQVPDLCYYWSCLSILLYQTFDAMDGKHARRTGQSSALGQLFDHGCDACCVSLMLHTWCQAFQTGCSLDFFLILVFGTVS